MRENPYPYSGAFLRHVADMANRPPADEVELERRWVAAGMVLDHPVEARDVAEVRAFLGRWARLAATDTERARVELVNGLLAEATAHPRITDHGDSFGWHLHFRDDGIRMAAVLRAAVSVATARHLTERGMHRIGRCARDGCALVYVDDTRGGRQRYCTPACANRDAVRRHRARRAATLGPGAATAASPPAPGRRPPGTGSAAATRSAS